MLPAKQQLLYHVLLQLCWESPACCHAQCYEGPTVSSQMLKNRLCMLVLQHSLVSFAEQPGSVQSG